MQGRFLLYCLLASALLVNAAQAAETALFGMGCFWTAQSDFMQEGTVNPLPGILSSTVGYAGGTTPDPTYENPSDYKEAVKLSYDPKIISYDQLLDLFWHNIDPFDATGQFCDHDATYTSVIYYSNPIQQAAAVASKLKYAQQFGKEIKTEIKPVSSFYDAEAYHQHYKVRNPTTYAIYSFACGRAAQLKRIWGK